MTSTLRAKSLLDPYLPYLQQRWEQGCRNSNQLWKELQAQGFMGGYEVVNRWVEPRRAKPGRKHYERQQRTLHFLRQGQRGEALYSLAQRYVKIMRKRDVEAFDSWLEQCLFKRSSRAGRS